MPVHVVRLCSFGAYPTKLSRWLRFQNVAVAKPGHEGTYSDESFRTTLMIPTTGDRYVKRTV